MTFWSFTEIFIVVLIPAIIIIFAAVTAIPKDMGWK